MRFTLKWLLGFTTWVAVVCASFLYLSAPWATAIVLLAYFSMILAVIGSILGFGSGRAFCVGFAVTFGFLHVAALGGWSDRSPQRLAIDEAIKHLARLVPIEQAALREYLAEYLQSEQIPPDVPMQINYKLYGSLEVLLILQEPGGFYTAKRVPGSVLGGFRDRDALLKIIRQHLLILMSIIGGLSGLLFHRSRQRDKSIS